MILSKNTQSLTNVKLKATLAQQEHLKKLPLPSLSETISRWLPTTLPHLNDQEYARTRELAHDFIKQAEPMQKYLQDKAARKDNWVTNSLIAFTLK